MKAIIKSEYDFANMQECVNCGINKTVGSDWCAIVQIPNNEDELLCCSNCGKLYAVHLVELQDITISDGYITIDKF